MYVVFRSQENEIFKWIEVALYGKAISSTCNSIGRSRQLVESDSVQTMVDTIHGYAGRRSFFCLCYELYNEVKYLSWISVENTCRPEQLQYHYTL